MLFQSEDTMKILVVHRSTPALDQILADLRGKDYAVKHHESGLDGLFTSRLEKFDLIICGTELPIVTGYELVRAVRTYSVNRGTPVIFLADEVNEKTEKLGQALCGWFAEPAPGQHATGIAGGRASARGVAPVSTPTELRKIRGKT